MSRRTPAPRPRTDADDLAAALKSRRRTEPEPTEHPQAISGIPDIPAPSQPATPPTPALAAATQAAMVRRSWYLPAAVADELASAVDELHFTTRRPKHEVLTALLRAGLDHLDDASATLN